MALLLAAVLFGLSFLAGMMGLGVVAAILGIGTGFLMIPTLVILGMTTRIAAATNSVIVTVCQCRRITSASIPRFACNFSHPRS